MKAKKEKKWFTDSPYRKQARIRHKWEEKIKEHYKGKSFAEKLDKALEELFKTKI